MPRMPQIKSVMTPFPYSIAPSASIEEAREMMRSHDIRHLPVCEKHQVQGMLSERDIHVATELLPGQSPLSVGDLCAKEPFLVDLSRPLNHVAAEMARRRVGSAIVMRGDKLAGILTTTDVCRLLAAVLEQAYESNDEGDDDAA